LSILLVRHGETSGNAKRVIQTPDIPLSETGIAQARRLADRLSGREVAAIVSSDLARARMTAEAVREATRVPLHLDPGLQERNFGDLRGTPYAELEVDPFAPGYVPPGGESWEALHARVDAVWARVAGMLAGLSGDLVVVTHGLVCHSLVTRRLALPPDLAPPAGFANTSLTEIGAEPPWRVRRLNCTEHLEGPETAQGSRLEV
jgi:probable phosphoglycerate mutase